MLLPYCDVQKKGMVLISSFRPSMLRAAVRPVMFNELKQYNHNMEIRNKAKQLHVETLCGLEFENILLYTAKLDFVQINVTSRGHT